MPRPSVWPRSNGSCVPRSPSSTAKAKAAVPALLFRRTATRSRISTSTAPCGAAMKCGLTDGRFLDAVLVGLDPGGDIALIKLLGDDEPFPVAEFGDSDAVRAGDWVYVAGNPFLLADDFRADHQLRHHLRHASLPISLRHAARIRRLPADRRGRQSRQFGRAAVRCRGQAHRHQWPLLVRKTRPRQRRRRLRRLDQSDQTVREPSQERPARGPCVARSVVSTDPDGRVIVDDILEDSDAYRRGLRYGDEIVRFGGRDIATANAFKNVLGTYPEGWRVPIVFRRDGKEAQADGATWPRCIARASWRR